MTYQRRKLERLASAILGAGPKTSLAKARTAENVGLSRKDANRALKKRNRAKLLAAYRQLPKETRRQIVAEYKSAGPDVDWNDWLEVKSEIVYGLPLPRARAGDHQDSPSSP